MSSGDCGNGEIDPGEVCDDGNNVDGDGCAANCRPRPGMIYVPAGPFMMGCAPTDDMCDDSERPYHEVQLSAFEIDETEVTIGAYAECVDDQVCEPDACQWVTGRDEDVPIACVVWASAETFCSWAGKRLPTEAEWEKAARGTDERIFPWGNEPDVSRAVFSAPAPLPVGSKPEGDSPYGVKDMAGNIAEWVADWWQYYYYEEPGPWVDPQGPPDGLARCNRGGSYATAAIELLRTASRRSESPTIPQDNLGFRCARSP